MPVLIHDYIDKPNRVLGVPGYTGFVPGLRYNIGKAYGGQESNTKQLLPVDQEPNEEEEEEEEVAEEQQVREPEECEYEEEYLPEEEYYDRAPEYEEVHAPPRRVQWTDGEYSHVPGRPMEEVGTANGYNRRHAATQWNERELEAKSATTQWSDQEAHGKKYSAATQWTPFDFAPLKTIPGYTGHMPGRTYVTPGKTFGQDLDAVLANFQPKSTVTPMSRHTFATQNHHQHHYQNDPKVEHDPYFDRRPPSTYAKGHNPIPGYQGFVPRVRTSTSALGIRYIKAVEKSLQALHDNGGQQGAPSPQQSNGYPPNNKLHEQRPLHTPRHRPHPSKSTRHLPPEQKDEEEDWMNVYRRPPSTYQNNSRTYIPGYKGFIPHMRGSPNAVGVRYSKAALKCLEASQSEQPGRPRTDPVAVNQVKGGRKSNEVHRSKSVPRLPQDANYKQNGEEEEQEEEEEGEEVGYQENGIGLSPKSQYLGVSRHQPHPVAVADDRPYREEHAHYLGTRRPSTYKTDERHPIPGYQGFVPRMRDSPTTLGLRYTKAAVRTLDDVHRMQKR